MANKALIGVERMAAYRFAKQLGTAAAKVSSGAIFSIR
jgi:hypothetical protein